MSIVIRAVRRKEELGLYALWTQVFGLDEEFFRPLMECDPDRVLTQTQVALDGKKIVSAVQYFVRPTRGLNGYLHKMGGIANVATLPEYRGQGLSSKLLEMSIKEMQDHGCDWSMLFTGVNAHYAKLGWRTMPTRIRKAHFRQTILGDTGGYVGWRIDTSEAVQKLTLLASIYDFGCARRPLTLVRTLRDWRLVVAKRLAQPQMRVYLGAPARRKSAPVAYLFASFDKGVVEIREACFEPGAQDAFKAALLAVREDVQAEGITEATVRLPSDRCYDEGLKFAFREPVWEDCSDTMARPLDKSVTMDYLAKLFQAPGASYWQIDGF